MPASLLAQVDSAVGIEQSASSPTAKNSLGSYMAPALVVIDPALLETLPEREIRAGLGEAISHGMVIEAYASHKMGLLDISEVDIIKSNLEEIQLLQPLSKKYSVEKILSKLYIGKNEPIFALLKKLGDPDTLSQTIPKQIMQETLQWYMKVPQE